jgi:hypothetical protein
MDELYWNSERYKLLFKYALGNFELKKLNDKEKLMLSELLKSPKMERIIDLLKKAGNKPGCNFNLKDEDGFKLRLPHLSSMCMISRLLVLKSYLTSSDESSLEKSAHPGYHRITCPYF